MPRRATAQGGLVSYERVKFTKASRFLTLNVGEESSKARCQGAFIRLRPGPKTSDAQVADHKARLEAYGARVKVMPRPQQEVASVEAEVEGEVGTIRDELTASMEAAVNVCDEESVMAAIEECLSEVGL